MNGVEASSTAMRAWRSDAGLAAQRRGLFGVLVRMGKFLPEAFEAAKGRPDAVIDAFADLPGLIDTLIDSLIDSGA